MKRTALQTVDAFQAAVEKAEGLRGKVKKLPYSGNVVEGFYDDDNYEDIDGLPASDPAESLDGERGMDPDFTMKILRRDIARVLATRTHVHHAIVNPYGNLNFTVKLGDTFYKPEDITKELLEKSGAAAAPYGDLEKKRTVFDDTVRKAITLDVSDVVFDKETMHYVQNALDSVFPGSKDLRTVPYRINLYGEGGHFNSHLDTPRQPDHLGTFVLTWGEYTGGEFKVSCLETGHTLTCVSRGSPRGVVMRGTCPHEVKAVESGERFSLILDVFGTAPMSPEDDPIAIKLRSRLRAYARQNPELTHIGVVLRSLYTEEQIREKRYAWGCDALLVAAGGPSAEVVPAILRIDDVTSTDGSPERKFIGVCAEEPEGSCVAWVVPSDEDDCPIVIDDADARNTGNEYEDGRNDRILGTAGVLIPVGSLL